MELGVATHFAQGWSVEIVEPAMNIGVDLVRDELPWPEIEMEPGVYMFSGSKAVYPDLLEIKDINLNLVFTQTNHLHDSGFTPYTPEGREAFAQFVSESLRRHQFVSTVEIGNEYNSQPFVSGPIKSAPYEERAGSYVDLLKAVDEVVSVEFPQVKVLGGAAHSIPIEFLLAQAEMGALDYLDGIAFHPYSSPPEKVGVHLDMLRTALAPATPSLHATEFGGDFATFDEAARYLIKMTTALSAARVESAYWYSLKAQQYLPMMELLASDGSREPAAEAFDLIKNDLLSLGDAVRLPSAADTYIYAYGTRAIVAWGQPRLFSVASDIEWRDSQGRSIDPPTRLDPDIPVIALSQEPIDFDAAIVLGPSGILADSFHDFDPRLDAKGATGNWRFSAIREDGTTIPLEAMGGGGIQSEAWRPYIGSHRLRPFGISEDVILPVDFTSLEHPPQSYRIRERFVSPSAKDATICGLWNVDNGTTDGVSLQIFVDGSEVISKVVKDSFRFRIDDQTLSAGSHVDILTGPKDDPTGDRVHRHLRIVEAWSAEASCRAFRSE